MGYERFGGGHQEGAVTSASVVMVMTSSITLVSSLGKERPFWIRSLRTMGVLHRGKRGEWGHYRRHGESPEQPRCGVWVGQYTSDGAAIDAAASFCPWRRAMGANRHPRELHLGDRVGVMCSGVVTSAHPVYHQRRATARSWKWLSITMERDVLPFH